MSFPDQCLVPGHRAASYEIACPQQPQPDLDPDPNTELAIISVIRSMLGTQKIELRII